MRRGDSDIVGVCGSVDRKRMKLIRRATGDSQGAGQSPGCAATVERGKIHRRKILCGVASIAVLAVGAMVIGVMRIHLRETELKHIRAEALAKEEYEKRKAEEEVKRNIEMELLRSQCAAKREKLAAIEGQIAAIKEIKVKINRILGGQTYSEFNSAVAARLLPMGTNLDPEFVLASYGTRLTEASDMEELNERGMILSREFDRLRTRLKVLEECYFIQTRKENARHILETGRAERQREQRHLEEKIGRGEIAGKRINSLSQDIGSSKVTKKPQYEHCDMCNGTGSNLQKVKCPNCKGKGFSGEYEGVCPDCNASGDIVVGHRLVPCRKCKGTGGVRKKLKCNQCNETGRIKEQVRCKKCDGKGRIVRP